MKNIKLTDEEIWNLKVVVINEIERLKNEIKNLKELPGIQAVYKQDLERMIKIQEKINKDEEWIIVYKTEV